MENEIYREALIDLFENPINRGEMVDPHLEAHAVNHLCGDEVTIQIELENSEQGSGSNKKIKKALFSGDGCLLSQVSSSFLTSTIEGKIIEEANKISTNDILNLIGFTPTPSRMKCALLCLDALKEALNAA